jgi:predicted hydrocarbon binding protein
MKIHEENNTISPHALSSTRIPSWLWSIILRCTTDNLGEKGTNTLLRRAGLEKYIGVIPPYDDSPTISALEYSEYKKALFEIFGETGARPILLRAGRLGYQCVLDTLPPSIKVASKMMILLPERPKLLRAVTEFLKSYDEALGTRSEVIESDEKVIVDMHNSTSQNLNLDIPVCYVERELLSSVLKKFVGEGFEVKETLCMGKGDPICRFEIVKKEK